jgi:Rnl2 family RNA ligase
MMNFVKYNSVTNSYQKKTIDLYESLGFSEVEWCVTNKLHGANLAIYLQDGKHQTASRNQLLSEHESDMFYKFHIIKAQVYTNVTRIRDMLVGKLMQDINTIIVYGELFGGSYPHPDVPKNNDVRMVQKGVFYSPYLHFSVFDIQVDGKFIDYDLVCEVCDTLNIEYQEILKKGTLAECLQYPNDFEDETYLRYGYPSVLPKIENNITEGVVIKPIKTLFLASGSRVILKNKNEKFKEKNSARKRKPAVELSDDAKHGIEAVEPYITENRLDTVTSKLGELEAHKIGTFIKEFVSDVFKDAHEDGVLKYHLEKVDQKAVNKFVSNTCRDMIIARLRGE